MQAQKGSKNFVEVRDFPTDYKGKKNDSLH